MIFPMIGEQDSTSPCFHLSLFFYLRSTWHTILIHMKFQNVDTIIFQCAQWRVFDNGYTFLQQQLKEIISTRNIFYYKRIIMNSSNTHFMSLISVRNIFYCRRVIINSFDTYFLSLISIRNKFQCMGIIINSFITDFLSLLTIRNRL